MDTAPPEPTPSVPRRLSAPLLRYLEARGILLSLEATEAVQQLLRILLLAGIAGTAAFTGWLLLTAALISLLMERTGWSWEKSVAVLGAVHLGLALIFLVAMRRHLGRLRLFTDTLNEFKKDRAWLASQPHQP